MARTVSLFIDLPASHRFHIATLDAVWHASKHLGRGVKVDVVPTDRIDSVGDGVVIGPGSPYRDPSAVEDAIRASRASGLPLVATWGGFQHVLVEHARNLCGIADAVHGEYDLPGMRVVSLLACSLTDNEIEVQLTAGSRLHDLYNADTAVERTTCSYGLDPDHAFVAGLHGMRVAAIDDTGEVRAIERPAHPFFIATLFQPQLTTSAASPHPIWLGFINALEHP